jgi:hypothetical protein
MLRISYQVTAKEPLLHGSDNTTTGNKRLFRRERHRLPKPEKTESSFDDDAQRRNAALCILFGIYKSIDPKIKSDYYGYYDPFSANIIAATHNRTRFEFLNQLCESCGVRTIQDKETTRVMEALDRFSDGELMYTMQRETQYLMLMLRDVVKNNRQPSFIESRPDAPRRFFEKQFDDVPFISGNAIGGLMRRLAIRDFFNRIGYEKEKMGIDKSTYHELMTGGNISESTGTISLEKKETITRLCPPVGVLGSALGNMTTTSLIKIGSLRPQCSELGFETQPSYWELLGTNFGTRHDTSKAEMELSINGNTSDRNADQMIYYNEVLNAGTTLYSDMMLASDDPLIVSCFWHMIRLWKEFGYIAGRSARGYGRIDIDIQIPENANALYLSHLEKVKVDALDYFTVERKVLLPA